MRIQQHRCVQCENKSPKHKETGEESEKSRCSGSKYAIQIIISYSNENETRKKII